MFLISCQKENLTEKANTITDQEIEMAKNVKKYYDIVKAANDNQIIERDGISLSLNDALKQIETLFSYAYGDYTIPNDSTYTYIDTIVMSFTSTPVMTDDFVSLTNQTFDICKTQFDRISYSGPKYFYAVNIRKLSNTSTTVTVSVRSVFGAKYNPSNDFTPIGEWPVTVFDSKLPGLYCDDRHTCDNPNSNPNYSGKQAPSHIAEQVNRYKSYLNYDPVLAISAGQPNPYINMVFVNKLELVGSSERWNEDDVYTEKYYTNSPNYWDTLLHLRNPDDMTLNDCITEFNGFKISLPNTPDNNSYDCDNNTWSRCLGPDDCNHYYNRLMHCILAAKSRYGRDYFLSIDRNHINNVCIGSICSYWMSFTIIIGDMVAVPTKEGDKLAFPQSI